MVFLPEIFSDSRLLAFFNSSRETSYFFEISQRVSDPDG